MKGRVGGLAVWFPGTQFWFVPGLLLAPELAVIGRIDCPQARALKPRLATSMPPAVSNPILKRSRRLVSPAAISSRRFFAASHICFEASPWKPSPQIRCNT